MAQVYDDAIAAADAAIATVFGETARLTPRRASDYRAAATDPDRPAKDVWGVFTDAPKGEVVSYERARPLLTSVSVSAEFSIDKAEADKLGYLVAKNDLLTVRGMGFTINSAPIDDRGGVAFRLTRED